MADRQKVFSEHGLVREQASMKEPAMKLWYGIMQFKDELNLMGLRINKANDSLMPSCTAEITKPSNRYNPTKLMDVTLVYRKDMEPIWNVSVNWQAFEIYDTHIATEFRNTIKTLLRAGNDFALKFT